MSDDEVRARLRWRSLPWAMFTTCVVCREVLYCHGKSRDRMVCLGCFVEDEDNAKLRRGGTPGKRRRYRYSSRRQKSGMIELVRVMHEDEGLVVGAIAKELDLSEKTVRNYIAEARRLKKQASSPLPVRPSVPRKEEPEHPPTLISGDASEGSQRLQVRV